MKNLLITGGAGFIGSNLCETAFDQGYSVTILDNLSPQIHGNWENSFLYKKIKGKCNFIKGDVCNRKDWQIALENADAVIHLAAETGTGQSMYQVEHYYKVNVLGTAILVDLLINEHHQVRKIIVASSRAVYGEGKYLSKAFGVQYPSARNIEDMQEGLFDLLDAGGDAMQPLATDESSALHPISAYGLTKLAQEQMIMTMAKQTNIPAVALRFQNVYGPGQSLNNPYTGLLAVFANRIRNGSALDVYEDGNESRDFVYISDAVNAIMLSLNGEANDYTFNVGSGAATSILAVARLMSKYFNTAPEIKISNRFRVGDIRHNYADLSLVSERIGYKPKISFERGLKNFVDWVLSQQPVSDRYDESVKEIITRGLMK